MTCKAHEASVSPEPGAKMWYLPLINRKPSVSNTISSPMTKALTISFNVGYIIRSDSIPIYNRYAAVQIDMSIIFNDSNQFKSVVPILEEIVKMYA